MGQRTDLSNLKRVASAGNTILGGPNCAACTDILIGSMCT
jgi:hypothetical protein